MTAVKLCASAHLLLPAYELLLLLACLLPWPSTVPLLHGLQFLHSGALEQP